VQNWLEGDHFPTGTRGTAKVPLRRDIRVGHGLTRDRRSSCVEQA